MSDPILVAEVIVGLVFAIITVVLIFVFHWKGE